MNTIEAGALYDGMSEAERDIPRAEFVKQVVRLTDPKQFQRDLESVIQTKQTRRTMALNEQRKIDRALANGG